MALTSSSLGRTADVLIIISKYGQWQRRCEFVNVLFGNEVIIKIFIAAYTF